ncbi:MAG: glutamate 5-kinase [Litoreibacter sp.]|nr:glutamate 5-kinase [Litoreibacter sp.]MCY4335704.1 glutamate 5-kinase [Litoreibacter sp.]
MASLSSAKRLIIKIGSALLVDRDSGALRSDWLAALALDVSQAKARGQDVVIVSSGSIALGRGALGLPSSALPLEQSQAAAAVGQIRLARAYEEALAPHGITTAQVLVTLEDSQDRRRYLNSRATLEQLLSLGVVPIVNENDTVATDEIRYGDNDRLAAQVAVTVGADLVVLLSDVDGLYDANPAETPDATRYEVVKEITSTMEDAAGDAGSGLSKGGMKTKLMAARTAMAAGAGLVITHGDVLQPLCALEDGANATWFLAKDDPKTARKRWISAMKPQGVLVLDAGAETALRAGKSLLPAGVTRISGVFGRGDPIELHDASGHIIAHGLARYASDEAQKIIGRKSSEIEALLGYPGRAALVHRDDMVL